MGSYILIYTVQCALTNTKKIKKQTIWLLFWFGLVYADLICTVALTSEKKYILLWQWLRRCFDYWCRFAFIGHRRRHNVKQLNTTSSGERGCCYCYCWFVFGVPMAEITRNSSNNEKNNKANMMRSKSNCGMICESMIMIPIAIIPILMIHKSNTSTAINWNIQNTKNYRKMRNMK